MSDGADGSCMSRLYVSNQLLERLHIAALHVALKLALAPIGYNQECPQQHNMGRYNKQLVARQGNK